MGDSEAKPAQDRREARLGDDSGPAHAGSGDVIRLEEMELAAARAAKALRRALSTDEEAREQLVELLQQISTLQARMGEWNELHHILRRTLAALSPFYADLRSLGRSAAGPANGRALLRAWRLCQTELDRLADFENELGSVQAPRPSWRARVASLRREMEDRLREEAWSVAGLLDLTDELDQACNCYLDLADWELRRAAGKVQRLYTHLFGGLL